MSNIKPAMDSSTNDRNSRKKSIIDRILFKKTSDTNNTDQAQSEESNQELYINNSKTDRKMSLVDKIYLQKALRNKKSIPGLTAF